MTDTAILTERVQPELPATAPQVLTVAGHELTIFVESPPLLEHMIRDIQAAKERVWLETYIFYNDDGGTRVAEALKQKARDGLDVRLLYDAVGSNATPAAFFSDMQTAGVKVHVYHSLLEGLRRFRPLTILNRRNHRKLLIVDDAAGYFGGMNIIDNVEDVQQLKREDRPKSSGWRDVHVRIAGPQVCDLADSFGRIWNRIHGIRAPKKRHASLRAQLRHGLEEESGESIRFFESGPRGRPSRIARVYARFLRQARQQITISMAYFIPVGGPLRSLLAARRRRIAVRVIVPGKSDVKLVQRATAYLYDRLIRRGFRIYERRHRMLHSKMIIIDDVYTLVGSANLDPRSLYFNLEFMAVIRSQALARVMHRICRFEISHSERITMGHCRRISTWQRFLNRLAWMLHWWL